MNMTPEDIKKILEDNIDNVEVVEASGDGSHFQVTVVGDVFDGLRPVKRQQMIYQHLNEHITSGALHALGIKTYTQAEWQTAKKLQVG
jgi:acid stress-induced BolA-like protein IbaG/YrbA